MLKRKDIKDGTLVYAKDTHEYGIIKNVGNAKKKGDRALSSTPDDELSYTVVDIVSDENYDGICEYSAMTSDFFSVVSKTDIDIYLAKLEADTLMKFAVAKKSVANINDAINRFSKINSK